jgi:NAD+ diphosphatase
MFGTLGNRFVAAIEPPESGGEPLIFAFAGHDLVLAGDGVPTPAHFDGGLRLEEALCIGSWDARPCYALAIETVPAELRAIGLRAVHGELGGNAFAVAARANQLVRWDREHRFCGRCGASTERAAGEPARVCPRCQLHSYPRISPVIMVLIHRGREVLLAKNSRSALGFYSALAGFVEAGETLEETVHREVREEVGVRVDDIRYFASQSWPFPHSLMIAFTAEYAGGEVTPDGIEIEDARFFDVDALPQLPPAGISIASWLIHTTAAQLRADPAALARSTGSERP